ncbi:secretion protein HlyD [Thalassotalea sp. 42_200_T64]|nr:secretion protein HlyD [Thalassotalea sp. 42_200_T64]
MLSLALCSFLAISASFLLSSATFAASTAQAEQVEPEKGVHNGRMLRAGDFAIELAIFETGVPPEFRVWATAQGQAVQPEQVNVQVKLIRLGNQIDDINFYSQSDFLRGDMEIYEPHSFVVSITAKHEGKQYQWQYDNFEGRTQIADDIASAMAIRTAFVGGETLTQTMKVYGKLVLPNAAIRQVSARFDGEIKAVHVSLGDIVVKGQKLLTIESNASLLSYVVKSPANGTITQRHAHAGEQSRARTLLEITNQDTLIAELAIFPKQLNRLAVNAKVMLRVNEVEGVIASQIFQTVPEVRPDQAKIVRAKINNSEHKYSIGAFVSAEVEVATFDVPLAVKRSGLQGFRNFTVVYAKVGDDYEVRMLELGRIAGDWVEVLGGISAGTEYVVDNSYIIKADIEKSGASHDH